MYIFGDNYIKWRINVDEQRVYRLSVNDMVDVIFNAKLHDWRYTLILPNGKILGTTGGKNSAKVGFCIECHAVAEEQDSRFFLDEDYRK